MTDATPRRRGRPPGKAAPAPSRRKLFDAARVDAVVTAYGPRGSGDLFPAECGSLSGAKWFCILSKPHAERQAAAELRAQDFPVFLPMEVVWRGHHGQRKPVAKPCVPRYMFVRFNPATDPWRAIWSTRGVSRLISFSPELPAPCRASEVEAVSLVILQPLGQVDPTSPSMIIGQRGSVTSGPLVSFAGELLSVEPDGRLVVRLNIFGRPTPITLEPEQFRAAS